VLAPVLFVSAVHGITLHSFLKLFHELLQEYLTGRVNVRAFYFFVMLATSAAKSGP